MWGQIRCPAERMDLRVAREEIAGWAHHERLVVEVVGAGPHGTADHQGSRPMGEFPQERGVLPLRSRTGLLGLHAEPGGEEFGQHEQATVESLEFADLGTDPGVVRGAILPRDIHLEGGDVHGCRIRRRTSRSQSPRDPGS
jgi:hypothetical protein